MPSAHPHFLWKDLFRKGADRKTVIQILRENVLFATLTERELRYLANLVYERVYQPLETIFAQNDRGMGMYLIAKGRVGIKTLSPKASPSKSDLELVTELAEGSFFGELALVDPHNVRTASAIAMERTVVIGFFKPDLTEIMERKPAMGSKVLFQLSTVLGRRLSETTDKITTMQRQAQAEREGGSRAA